MKRILPFLILLLASPVQAGIINLVDFYSGDDVTINNLETNVTTVENAINGNIEGGTNIKPGSLVSADFSTGVSLNKFRDEAFNDFTVSGMLPPTATGLTSITTAGVSYVSGIRMDLAAIPHTYTDSKTTYVYITPFGYNFHEDTTTTDADHLLLAKVTTSGGNVTAVDDLRTLSIQITTTTTNFPSDYRNQAMVSKDSTTAVHAEPGTIAIGNTLYSRLTDSTTLTITNPTHWINSNGAMPLTDTPVVTNVLIYVYAYNNYGSQWDIKFASDDAVLYPKYSDTSDSTTGTLQYIKVGTPSAYYRALAWIWISADATTIIDGNYSQFPSATSRNTVYKSTGAVNTTSSVIPYDDTVPQSNEGKELFNAYFKPTNANSTIRVKAQVNVGSDSGGYGEIALFRNSEVNALASCILNIGGNTVATPATIDYSAPALTTTPITFRVRYGSDAGNSTVNGLTTGRKHGGVYLSSLSVEEI